MKSSRPIEVGLSLVSMVFFLLAAANGFSGGRQMKVGTMVAFLVIGMLCIVVSLGLQVNRRLKEREGDKGGQSLQEVPDDADE